MELSLVFASYISNFFQINHEFVKMHKIESTSYACYDCKQAKFEGYLGFSIVDGLGHIAQIRYTD